jgi:Cys-tRNA(Pro) deacylase
MVKSIDRVRDAIASFDNDITIKQMPDSTRTAQDAANAIGCEVGQIVKSLIFETAHGDLVLLLVSGKHNVDLKQFKNQFGQALERADPQKVRKETGFAIGGVAPIGHLKQVDTWLDQSLLEYDVLWAAAGAPNAVFSVTPKDLQTMTNGQLFTADG